MTLYTSWILENVYCAAFVTEELACIIYVMNFGKLHLSVWQLIDEKSAHIIYLMTFGH